MIDVTEFEGALRFTVRVVPRASKSEIVGEYSGALKIRLAAPPVDGAANNELKKTLAKVLQVPVRNIEITSGQTAKVKQIRVHGATVNALQLLASN